MSDPSPASTPSPDLWDPETVAFMVAMSAQHGISDDARPEDQVPMFTWADSGPDHEVHLLGYLEPTDGRWRYVAELSEGPHRHARLVRSHYADDPDDVFAAIAGMLNEVLAPST